MVALPAEIPPTTPELLTVATVILLLVQAPPAAASLSVTEEPAQTELPPVMEPETGSGFIVTDLVATEVPQKLATV